MKKKIPQVRINNNHNNNTSTLFNNESGDTPFSPLICLTKKIQTQSRVSYNANAWHFLKIKGWSLRWIDAYFPWNMSLLWRKKINSLADAVYVLVQPVQDLVLGVTRERQSLRKKALYFGADTGLRSDWSLRHIFYIPQTLKKQLAYHNAHLLGNLKIEWVASEEKCGNPSYARLCTRA